MIIIHILEPFASGVTSAISSIAKELPEFTHIIVHGSRNWTESAEKVKQRFPPGVTFVEWKNAAREISLIKDVKAFRELFRILKNFSQRHRGTEGKNFTQRRGGAEEEQGKEVEDVVVHLHSSKAGFLGRLVCRVLGIKAVVYTPHCGAFLRTDAGLLKRKLYWFFEWLGGCFGGRVVGCGPSEGALYQKLGKNTTYVSNGVALKDTSKAAEECNLISVTGIATFQKDPALWNAVASSCATTARENGFSFCWIGDGPQSEKLDRDLITVTGWKSADEVEDLLKKTAIYFSASAWEGLPYGVLEAMSASSALLLRNIQGNRELVIPGENGWLFNTPEEAAERLKAMMKDRKALLLMGKRSREIIEQSYTLKQMGEGYRRIYTQAAGKTIGGES